MGVAVGVLDGDRLSGTLSIISFNFFTGGLANCCERMSTYYLFNFKTPQVSEYYMS